MLLVRPAREHLPEYAAALERGWSPDNLNPKVARLQLAELADDPDGFLALRHDPEARGGPIVAPDGSVFERLPGYQRWMWSDGFCGSVGFRWRAPGDPTLPAHVLGHIGYSVVPWRRREGHATRALAELLSEARALDLPYVELTTDPDNEPSQRVVLANGGRLLERFTAGEAYGAGEKLRFRIEL